MGSRWFARLFSVLILSFLLVLLSTSVLYSLFKCFMKKSSLICQSPGREQWRYLKGLTEKSLMKGLCTEVWVGVREPTRAMRLLELMENWMSLSPNLMGPGREVILKLGPWKRLPERKRHPTIRFVVWQGGKIDTNAWPFSSPILWPGRFWGRFLWTSLRSGTYHFHQCSTGLYLDM